MSGQGTWMDALVSGWAGGQVDRWTVIGMGGWIFRWVDILRVWIAFWRGEN